MKVIYIFVLALVVICLEPSKAQNQVPTDPRIAARVKEIEAYEPIAGTWEGHFFVTSAPDDLMVALAETGTKDKGGRIRIKLSDQDDPEVYLKYPNDDDWKLIDGELGFFSNAIGWYIYIEKGDGVWIEKFSITFDRVKEREAAITFTRTVHNWFIPESTPNVVDFYHMFGVGEVRKIETATSNDP